MWKLSYCNFTFDINLSFFLQRKTETKKLSIKNLNHSLVSVKTNMFKKK